MEEMYIITLITAKENLAKIECEISNINKNLHDKIEEIKIVSSRINQVLLSLVTPDMYEKWIKEENPIIKLINKEE